MLRVLTLSSLFPDATRPTFGVFVERQTVALAARDGVEVVAVAPIGLPPFPFGRIGRYRALSGLPVRETWRGIDVHRPRFTVLPATGGRFHVGALTAALAPVLDSIRRGFAFDVIDASFFFPDGPAAVALGKRYGVPVSIKARGADIHHWGTAKATAPAVLAAGRAADGLLAVSAAMTRDMVTLGMPAERIAVHYTGVDRARFRPVDRARAKGALGVEGPVVLSLGALIARKRHDVAIEAVAALPGVTLVIAGAGAERDPLARLAARRGVAHRVRFLGSVPHDDMPAVIAAADVMALASTSEGLANAWVEALACGTPIVVADAGGAREVVTGPAAGRIAARDGAPFAAAIDEVLAAAYPQDAVAAFAARFSWEANAAALEVHLSALVARQR